MSAPSKSLIGRIGAQTLHSRYDSRKITQPARDAFLARFEREVDPDGVLSLEERVRRATFARKAYFTKLALKSAKVRSARAAARGDP